MDSHKSNSEQVPIVYTDGGSHTEGSVHVEQGDFIGRDKNVFGDEIRNIFLTIPRPLIVTLVAMALVGLGTTLIFLTRIDKGTETATTTATRVAEVAHTIANPTPTPSATPLPTPTMPVMPSGDFNIAVADFHVVDENNETLLSEYAHELASGIAKHLMRQNLATEQLATILGGEEKINIWDPDEGHIDAVELGTEQERADLQNVDVFLYGTLQRLNNRWWSLAPRFFINTDSLSRVQEIYSDFALGAPIKFLDDNRTETARVQSEVELRLDILMQALMAMAYFDLGTSGDYERAATILKNAITTYETTENEGNHGLEILYLLFGYTFSNRIYLDNASANDLTMSSQLLADAEKAFRRGLEINSAYPRLHYGLAGVLKTKAILSNRLGDPCALDWNLIDAAKDEYLAAIRTAKEVEFNYKTIEPYTNLGLGRISYSQGLCKSSEADLETARSYFQATIDTYVGNPLPYLEIPASFAYAELADSYLYSSSVFGRNILPVEKTTAALSTASDNYAIAIDLNLKMGTPHRLEIAAEILPRRLISLCYANRQTEVIPYLNKTVSNFKDPKSLHDMILANLSSFLPKECTHA